jgi:PelA/Pel-15E family pectate lyase
MSRRILIVWSWVIASGLIFVGVGRAADERAPRQEETVQQAAARALRQATDFFSQQVATRGGYLWRYSADLSKREGENRASATTVWVQPPGTPAVGMALLEAHRLTGEAYLLDAAREAGYCLVDGQLSSGGWDYRIEFDPSQRRRIAYRVDGPRPGASDVSTLDDNTTQAALRFLIELDQTLGFRDERLHGAAMYALTKLLAVQYPNGGWPQRFSGPPDPAAFPVKRASFPETWPREWPGAKYSTHYTFNDNAIADTIDVLLLAGRVYNEPRFRAAAERTGDFILLAQLPEPQPGWAQQYDAAMQPVWARKFEPPSITGGEARGIITTLMRLARETGQEKYLAPIPRALAYYRTCKLADGRLARFYELHTNRPLYFTRDYVLTYDDGDLPTHYGFKIGNWVDTVAADFAKLQAAPLQPIAASRSERPRPTAALQEQARRTIAALDQRGAWVEDGRLSTSGTDDDTRRIIDTRTFIKNLSVLAICATASSHDRNR